MTQHLQQTYGTECLECWNYNYQCKNCQFNGGHPFRSRPNAPAAPYARVRFTNTIAKPDYVISEKLTKEIENILNDKCDESTAYRIPSVIRSRKLTDHDATIRNQTLAPYKKFIEDILHLTICARKDGFEYRMVPEGYIQEMAQSLRTPSTQEHK